MSRKFKGSGKVVGLCQVIEFLMTGNRTRGEIAGAIKADPNAVGHSLELLCRQGLAYKSHIEPYYVPRPHKMIYPGPGAIVFAWNAVPHQYTNFRGPESHSKENELPMPAHKPKPLNAKHKRLVEMADRPCGVTSRQFAQDWGIEQKASASAFTSATRASRVVCVVHSGDAKKVNRYFKERAVANLWLAGPAPDAGPVLVAIGARIKSKARQPGPQIQREKAPQGHAWRPDPQTAGSSKMAARAPCAPLPPTAIGPSPVLGVALKYYVDPATVQGPMMAEWRKLRGQA